MQSTCPCRLPIGTYKYLITMVFSLHLGFIPQLLPDSGAKLQAFSAITENPFRPANGARERGVRATIRGTDPPWRSACQLRLRCASSGCSVSSKLNEITW